MEEGLIKCRGVASWRRFNQVPRGILMEEGSIKEEKLIHEKKSRRSTHEKDIKKAAPLSF
ncbi:hypothetical protein [Bacillus horti]|uniref:Uncharacterized protein n=2 Tax=Caldalkalibacillus horti TaxID=77523 RepID=A0ABT9W384_9BACI|nr:hypothetical protein [Bacillus horti]MDQ0167699.1 hypothetical protein [Bacillus horti]